MRSHTFRRTRVAASAGFLAMALLLAGCSTELASFDDTYVPATAQEIFPIKVVERPVRLTVQTGPGGLLPGEVSAVTRFGKDAAARASTPISLHYSPASKTGRQAASQTAAILEKQGLPRNAIIAAPDGKGHALTLTFSAKVAETKPCGSWTENLRPNQFNEPGTAFGCAVQQNVAAMVANPGDFEEARPMPTSESAPQMPALKHYGDGTWTTPSADSDF